MTPYPLPGYPLIFQDKISRQYQEYQDKFHRNIKTFFTRFTVFTRFFSIEEQTLRQLNVCEL